MLIIALPSGEKTRRVSVFPAIVVPVVHMFTKNNRVSSQYRLLSIQLLEQGIGGRTTRTPFGSEQLDQHTRSTIASRKIRGSRERESCLSYEKGHENRECDSEPRRLHSNFMPIKRPFAGGWPGLRSILTLKGAPPQLKCGHPHHPSRDGRPRPSKPSAARQLHAVAATLDSL